MSWVGGGAHEEKGGTGTTLHYASKSLGKVQLKKVPATNKSRSAKINQNKSLLPFLFNLPKSKLVSYTPKRTIGQ
jgi:hypothetical protein